MLAAIDSSTFVLLALISKNILDVATGNLESTILKQGIYLFAVIAIQIITLVFHSLLNTYTQSKMIISNRNYLFSLVCKRKYSEISEYHSGDLLNRFTSDAEVLVSGVTNIIPSIVSMLSKIIGGLSALIVLDSRIAVIILVLGFSVPALGRMINKKYKKLHKEVQQTEGKTRAFMQECFENIVVVKTFTSEAPFLKRLNGFMKDNFVLKMKRAKVSVTTNYGLYTFFTIGYYALLVWGAGQIASKAITYGTLMAFLQLVSQLRAPLQNVSGIMPQYYSALASAERLMETEEGNNDLPPAEEDKLDELTRNFESIEINNITFAYKEETILQNCNFTAEKGKITAVTGESGSGKSTIFKIILGLYDPQGGNITINKDIKLDTSLRGLFAYVPQGNLILSGTIRENITLCDPDISEEQLIKAAKSADIYDLICSLPDGFDTVVSERGGGLSEGQIQRISIARALLTDAPVLLLDEATSALDEATETTVLKNIRELSGKTILFVTHRNTSLKVCDKIIHVENKDFKVIKE
ncbi:MAG: ABC transporter ATP-binding protein [Clostridia bacterium]|nr:ABC transporter ATP-binding protein [Clostridia bacterium]